MYLYSIITGCVFYYGLLHVGVYWFCHVSIFFYKVKFPFHSRLIDYHTKCIHLGVVLLAVSIPCVPVIVAFSTGGFLSLGYPQLVCVIRNSDAEHFSFVLPFSLIIATGITLLVMVFATIIKVQYECIHLTALIFKSIPIA